MLTIIIFTFSIDFIVAANAFDAAATIRHIVVYYAIHIMMIYCRLPMPRHISLFRYAVVCCLIFSQRAIRHAHGQLAFSSCCYERYDFRRATLAPCRYLFSRIMPLIQA